MRYKPMRCKAHEIYAYEMNAHKIQAHETHAREVFAHQIHQTCEAAAQVRSGAAHAWRRPAQPQLRAAYSRLRLKQRVLRSEGRSAIWSGHFSLMTMLLFLF